MSGLFFLISYRLQVNLYQEEYITVTLKDLCYSVPDSHREQNSTEK